MPSLTPTRWAVQCDEDCGHVFLTKEEYDAQAAKSGRTWICPKCGGFAYWDDKNYEKALKENKV